MQLTRNERIIIIGANEMGRITGASCTKLTLGSMKCYDILIYSFAMVHVSSSSAFLLFFSWMKNDSYLYDMTQCVILMI